MSRFFIENYGCQMNVSEAASLRALLIEHGHSEAGTPAEADVALLNTCSVRSTAEQRVRGRIGYYKGLNENTGTHIRVVVMGCMAQHYGLKLKKDFPGVVEAVWGTYHKEGVLDFLNALHGPRKGGTLDLENYAFLEAKPQEKFPFKSFVPISHGCDNFCSYCIVPHVRGREVSRDSDEIIRNVEKLLSGGVKEIMLIGQNVNSYRGGGGKNTVHFPELLGRIAMTTGVPRLGFMTAHPKDLSRELIEVIRDHPNILRQFHLPLQSGSDRILEQMNRKYTTEQYLEKVEMARTVPGIVLSTDIIVGFPGETESDFEKTVGIMEKVRYHEAYTYYYNRRSGTKAAGLKDDVPVETKKKRLAFLIDTQKGISEKRMKESIGDELTVLVETVSKKNKNEVSGRAHNSLMTFLEGDAGLVGRIVKVKVTGAGISGLSGKRIE